jgi:hypothetical protein
MHTRSFALLTLLVLAGCDPFFTAPHTQRVSTDDTAVPESLRLRYQEDAARLALRSSGDLTTAPIIIRADLRQKYYDALIGVYNATALPGRDAVVSTYAIHTFSSPELHGVLFAVDSRAPWVTNLRNGVMPTGEPRVDSLIAEYGLVFVSYNSWSFGNFIVLRSPQPLNMAALAARFAVITGLTAGPDAVIGDGNDITGTAPDAVTLDYSLGFGDCPARCIDRHFWTFRVADGRVTFQGERGPTP